MAQTLLIGLGGTGSRVVNNVVKELHLNGKEINDGQICCAVLDTNVNDNEAIEDSMTGVPVIPTSKPKRISQYLNEYRHLHFETWCPNSSTFSQETMIDGASELRLKSRIAFTDCVESGDLNQLEWLINDVLKNNSGSKIRIMIVSSLSGGTGSGMFIQVALWLRRILSQSEITIRGIFLLPDIFVSTLKDIKNNQTTKSRHYCNAYAAIRELNAISKIMKSGNGDISEPISLGSLFDSIKDADTGKPVYDFAFFVDDKNSSGVRLSSATEYEKMVAQLVYMQLYAPMKDDMYSEEDNAFLAFNEKDEPVYGCCGTAKASYPVHSVKEYCAIRATQDSLTSGWKKIDDEIDAKIAEKKQLERDGVYSDEVIDPRAEYIRLFEEKISVDPEEVGKDRFFIDISNDAKNDIKDKSDDGKITVKRNDKVLDFIKLLNDDKIDSLALRNSGTADCAIDNAEEFVNEVHTRDELTTLITDTEVSLVQAIDNFDANVDKYADSIVNAVFPYSMGDVQPRNRCTIYGLLSKLDYNGEYRYIHPVAMRYVLYKLVREMNASLRKIDPPASRKAVIAQTVEDPEALFDNKSTKETELTAAELLNSKQWYQREASFLDDFEKRYAQYVETKIRLCEAYEKEVLEFNVYKKLIERVELLIKQLEIFFKNLGSVQKQLSDALMKNVTATNNTNNGIVYVFGSVDAKEALYKSLDFDLSKSNTRINKTIVDAVYGKVCATKRPSNPDNAAYAEVGVIAAFTKETIDSFKKKIDSDSENSAIVNMDIYTAICKESDFEYEAKGGKTIDDVQYDVSSGKIKFGATTQKRHRDAFVACKKRLYDAAAPVLVHEKEISDNELGTTRARTKTFWGFGPAVVTACPYIGEELGVNADLQADNGYPENEMYCYRAVYGIEATYIPKFNESTESGYYHYYKEIVDKMVADAASLQGERALVRTPHLDKRWHRILPYVTAEKQKQSEMEFFHGLWLAIAYGDISVNNNGHFCIKRRTVGGHGNVTTETHELEYNGKPIMRTEVARLIYVLQHDLAFVGAAIPALEKVYADEIDGMVNYVGTTVMKTLASGNEDVNAINLVVRYNESRGRSIAVSAALIDAITQIASELAEKYNTDRSAKQLNEAKYRICKKIYDSSKRTKGKAEIFGGWCDEFKKLKLMDASVADESES